LPARIQLASLVTSIDRKPEPKRKFNIHNDTFSNKNVETSVVREEDEM
jgi:hypothetical protein